MSQETLPVNVIYHKTEFTFIPVTVTCADQSVKFYMPSVFDPLPDLCGWLKEIIAGAEQCHFMFDEEGPDTQLAFERSIFGSWLIIDRWASSYSHLEALVDPLQLVEAFYCGLIRYMYSPLYVHKNWDVEHVECIGSVPLFDRRSVFIEKWLIKNCTKVPAQIRPSKWL